MRVIIAGGRDYSLTAEDYRYLESQEISEVVCGGATGADECGREWAIKKGIPVKLIVAQWSKHGKAAGPIRNRHMAEYADCLIAFWDGKSRGTKNMIETAEKMGLKVYIHRY
jgi:predicted Rossmann-fold nucleotide-binding protein